MDSDIIQLTEELMVIREELSKINAKKSELEEKKKKAEYSLYNLMESREIQNFKHDVYGTIFKTHRIFCEVLDIDKVSIFLKEHGLFDEIMKLKPNKSRLNKLMQTEYIDRAEPILEDQIGIKATLVPKIGNRGGKKITEGGDVNSTDADY